MRRLLTSLTLLAMIFAGPTVADNLPEPQAEVVLTLSGEIGLSNMDGAAAFDLDMLEALETVSFETTTIWTEGLKTFTGVPLQAVLDAVNAEGNMIRASAINDYTVEIPADGVSGAVPIIAYQMDGATMSRRQKGPLWIVYPYDSDSQYRSEVIYSRSIWQLDRLEIVK